MWRRVWWCVFAAWRGCVGIKHWRGAFVVGLVAGSASELDESARGIHEFPWNLVTRFQEAARRGCDLSSLSHGEYI